MTRYIGDNFQAFNGQPIEINLLLEEGEEMPVISKAIFVINNGIIVKPIENPTFPLEIELNEDDTERLSLMNRGNLIVYDDEGRKLTCDGELLFDAKGEVYHEG